MTDTKLSEKDFLDAAAKGDTDAVRRGLSQGLNADTADSHGNTALMMAAARGQRDACQALVDAGANPAHKNKFGLGPRNWADWAENDGPIRNILG